MRSEIYESTVAIWQALNRLEKAVNSIATDEIPLRDVRAVRAALYQAAVVDAKMKKELF